jgi:hypothetical protein
MQFFKENEIDLAGLEMGTIKVNGSKIPMPDGDMNMNMDMDMEESRESMETPMKGMISRKRLKKELRRDEIEELYLAMIRQTNDDDTDVPEWIQKEYGLVLREELPPQMLPNHDFHQISAR